MKLLFVLSNLSLGGAERQLLLLMRGLTQLGHEVRLALFRPGGPLMEEARAAQLKIDVLGGNPFTMAFRLRALIKTMQPDVVHGYLTPGNLMSLVAMTFGRERSMTVWSMRASDIRMEYHGLKWRLAAALEKRLLRYPDLVIANSQAGRHVLLGSGASDNKIAVVANAIDLDRFRPNATARAALRRKYAIADNELLIGHVGRIDPGKDHSTFFQALAGLNHAYRAIVIAAGSEEARRNLAIRAERFGISSRLTLIAAASDVERFYAAFDVLCSSSAFGEGFGNVIAEALACGCPVVATNVGEAAAVIGQAGLIVPPGDAAAMARALSQVLEQREQYAALARHRVTPHSIEALSRATLAALEHAKSARLTSIHGVASGKPNA